jgi:site-specific DNA-methyltransferase (adenine-specific)
MIKLIHGKFELISTDVSPGIITITENLGKIDLIICDPPDNIGLKYDGFIDKQPISEYEANIRLWLSIMANLTDGPIFLTFNEKWTRIVENIIEEIDIPLIQRLQWYFTFGQDQTSKGKYALCCRPIYWLNSDYSRPEQIKIPSARQAKYNDKRAAKGGKMPASVWEFPRVCGTYKERRSWCPTQIPEALIERIVKGHCCPGGRILDPFLGSGTTAIVCQRLGINCIGIESSKPIIEKTAKHLGVHYE